MCGSPGSPRLPRTVHFFMTSGPKKASLANLTARVPAKDSPRSFLYFNRTNCGATSLFFVICSEGRVSVSEDGVGRVIQGGGAA